MTRDELRTIKGLGLAEGAGGKEYFLADRKIYSFDEAKKLAEEYFGTKAFGSMVGKVEGSTVDSPTRSVYVMWRDEE